MDYFGVTTMSMLQKKHRHILWICFVFFEALLLRGYLAHISDNYHAIAIGKVLLAREILKGLPFLRHFNPAHGPLHPYLLVFLLKFRNAFFTVPSAVSVFFGALTVVPYYGYLRENFDEKVALFSSFVMSGYSIHLLYSVLSTAAITYNFLLFTSFFCMLVALRKNKKTDFYLLCSAIMLGLACMERFDGLLFLPLMIFFCYRWFGAKRAFMYTCIVSLLPGAWMIINYVNWKNPFQFLQGSDDVVRREYAYYVSMGRGFDIIARSVGWIEFLYRTLTPFLAVPCFIGVLWASVQRRAVHILTCFWLVFIVFTIKTMRQELLLDYRYGIVLALLIIPFGIDCLMKIIATLSNVKESAGLVFAYAVIMHVLLMNAVLPMLPQVPQGLNAIGDYCREHIAENDRIIVDLSDITAAYYLPFASGLNEKIFIPILHLGGSFSTFNREAAYEWLNKHRPGFVIADPTSVLFSGKDVSRYTLEGTTEVMLVKECSAEDYRLYSLTYSTVSIAVTNSP